MFNIPKQIADWLETHWVNPAYSGWLLLILAIFFFGAATNTMAGWLYTISGISLAILAIAAILPPRSLRELRVKRAPIAPVSVGDQLTIEIKIENPSNQLKTLLQIEDILPYVLTKNSHTPSVQQTAIETIPPVNHYQWTYYQPTQQRGIYRWQQVELKTATPLGLFWCRRSRNVPAIAIVYPTVLPLAQCPLIDDIGGEHSPQFFQRDRQSQTETEGITRTLRPYRWGDPFRLIHWKTSARYGELRVRELEIFTGGQEITICLDSSNLWEPEDFEQAVIAAASLYFYASRNQLQPNLWTASTGLVYGHQVVLETLAGVNQAEEINKDRLPPRQPLIWLTQNSDTISSLPKGSRWVLWPKEISTLPPAKILTGDYPGLTIQDETPLKIQLQSVH